MKNINQTDFLIVGAGIIGLAVARELVWRFPGADIIIIEKEERVGLHASGRNSGVLHAGFYYTADSLKAKFTVDGNRLLTEYCIEKRLPINRCGKVVVARDEKELEGICELEKRGKVNGVNLRLIDKKELAELEPMAATYERALFSPTTSSVDPKLVCRSIALDLSPYAKILYNTRYIKRGNGSVYTNRREIKYKHLINTAGLYADKIAHHFGAGSNYTLIPFKGVYLQYNDDNFLKMHIYPVPNLKNPFLGVHYTKTVDGRVKIGPTSMPAFWRENYNFTEKFRFGEFAEVCFYEAIMFLTKSIFRSTAIDEIKKYSKHYLINQAEYLTKTLDKNNFGSYLTPGIRAQLVDKKTLDLIMDFVVEKGEDSTHVLNAVSPAFTCAFPFAKYVVDTIS